MLTHRESTALLSPARIQEGLSVMQDARQRRREQSKGKPDLPVETPKAAVGPCQRDSRRLEGPKAPLQNLEGRDGRQDSQQPQPQVSPVASVPRRSHSFCKDKRNSPLVVSDTCWRRLRRITLATCGGFQTSVLCSVFRAGLTFSAVGFLALGGAATSAAG